jgi:hypothetical protein
VRRLLRIAIICLAPIGIISSIGEFDLASRTLAISVATVMAWIGTNYAPLHVPSIPRLVWFSTTAITVVVAMIVGWLAYMPVRQAKWDECAASVPNREIIERCGTYPR